MKKKRYFIPLFLAPGILIYTGLILLPIIISMFYSLFTGPGLTPNEFVGLGNFIDLFTNSPYKEAFLNALKNNLKYYIMTTFLINISGLLWSVVLTRKFKGVKFFRKISFIPSTISILVTGFIFSLFLNPVVGPLNNILNAIGLGDLARPWLGDEKLALISIALISAWQYIGITILLYSSGIDNISQEVTEAATIDGANPIKMFQYIILPLLTPVLRIVFILSFVGTFTGFEIIYATQGFEAGPAYSTDIFGTLFYRAAFGGQILAGGWGFGMGAAISTVMFLIVAFGVISWTYIFRIKE